MSTDEMGPGVGADMGVAPGELDEDDLMRDLAHLHETRHTTLLHGSEDALERHTSRTQELEDEYLRRHPSRDVDPGRLQGGATVLHGQEPR